MLWMTFSAGGAAIVGWVVRNWREVDVFAISVFLSCVLLTPGAIIVLGIWSCQRHGTVLNVLFPTAVNVFTFGQQMLLKFMAVLFAAPNSSLIFTCLCYST